MITGVSFYCPDLVINTPSIEPSIVLPNSGGADLCLLESEEYPTPLVAVAMTGSGPGVCVISTSWPVEIVEESNDPGPVVPSVRLLSIPGRGGLTVVGECQVEVMILDITGRIIEIENIAEGEQVYIQLFPGVYQIIDSESGSLLGISLGDSSFPVGKVNFLDVNPLSFTEFLAGVNEHQISEVLKNLDYRKPLDEFYHSRLWTLFSEYLSVGGMPEAVSCYSNLRIESTLHATEEVRMIMHNLLNSYLADIAKHAGSENSTQITGILNSIPAQLGREVNGNAERFRFKGVIPGKNKYQNLSGAINWLVASSILLKVPLASRGEQPLSAWESPNRFKLYLHDIGILSHLAEIPLLKKEAFIPGFYKGWVAENFVAQELTASGMNQLHSWQGGKADVEFVIQSEGISIPVEVKAGRRTQAKSAGIFAGKYASPLIVKLGFWTNSLTGDNKPTLKLPLYAAGLLADQNRIRRATERDSNRNLDFKPSDVNKKKKIHTTGDSPAGIIHSIPLQSALP